MRHLPYEEQLSLLQSLAPRLPSDVVARVLSLSHTLSTEESSNLGLPGMQFNRHPIDSP